MGPKSRYTDIVVRVVPTPPEPRVRNRGARPSGEQAGGRLGSYDALIYSELAIPGLSPVSTQPDQAEQPAAIAGLPLVGTERISIHWALYDDYLASFVVGQKSSTPMSHRLSETLSPGLELLFSFALARPDPVRLWWDCEAVELNDLPWELVAYLRPQAVGPGFSFVRGRPPLPLPPLVPVSGPLRLALIYDPSLPPFPLLNQLPASPGALEVFQLTGPPREALQTVVREGYELVHIVADGIVTMAYDGVLYTHDEQQPELSAGELAGLLSGSRVTVLGLSSLALSNPDMMTIGNRQVPSAYRAFGCLARSDLFMPSVVAPLGPFEAWPIGTFWQGFYTTLANSLEICQAITAGQQASGQVPPIALFLRHPQDRLFKRDTASQQPSAADPMQIEAALRSSFDIVSQLDALLAVYGDRLPASVKAFSDEERLHQQRMSSELAAWVDSEEAK